MEGYQKEYTIKAGRLTVYKLTRRKRLKHFTLLTCCGVYTAPSEQPPPVYTSANSSAIALSWSAPDKPNGIIQFYQLYRNSSLVASLDANGTNNTRTSLLVATWWLGSRVVSVLD